MNHVFGVWACAILFVCVAGSSATAQSIGPTVRDYQNQDCWDSGGRVEGNTCVYDDRGSHQSGGGNTRICNDDPDRVTLYYAYATTSIIGTASEGWFALPHGACELISTDNIWPWVRVVREGMGADDETYNRSSVDDIRAFEVCDHDEFAFSQAAGMVFEEFHCDFDTGRNYRNFVLLEGDHGYDSTWTYR